MSGTDRFGLTGAMALTSGAATASIRPSRPQCPGRRARRRPGPDEAAGRTSTSWAVDTLGADGRREPSFPHLFDQVTPPFLARGTAG
jgi:hypothetical protein